MGLPQVQTINNDFVLKNAVSLDELKIKQISGIFKNRLLTSSYLSNGINQNNEPTDNV